MKKSSLNSSIAKKRCSLQILLDLISKRWFTPVLLSIQAGNGCLHLIKEDIPIISDWMVSKRLKELEKYSSIYWTRKNQKPQEATYSLLEKGEELCRLLKQMAGFYETIKINRAIQSRKFSSTVN